MTEIIYRHDTLRRQCEACDLEAEVAELKAELQKTRTPPMAETSAQALELVEQLAREELCQDSVKQYACVGDSGPFCQLHTSDDTFILKARALVQARLGAVDDPR